MCGPKSLQFQGIRGRYLRTKSGLLFGRDRDLETQSTTASMKKIKGQQAVDKVLFSLKQRAAKMFMSGFFSFPLARQSWVAAELLTASPTPRDHDCWAQNRKCKDFIRHARV